MLITGGVGTVSGNKYYADDIVIDDSQTGTGKTGTLDFSAVASDLTIVVSESGGVTTVTVTTVVSGKQYKVTATGIENITGGTGNNIFLFEGNARLAGNLTGFSSGGSALWISPILIKR